MNQSPQRPVEAAQPGTVRVIMPPGLGAEDTDLNGPADNGAIDALGSTRVIGDDATSPVTPAASVDRPALLGDFELVRKLGEGAMGAVYRARQFSFGRDVALKVLFPHVARNPKLVERLYREARAMAHLDHPNIVQAYAVGEDQGCHFVAMEFVDGQTLQGWLNRLGRLSVADAVHVAIACARGLAYAHAQGVVHRDVKPENVLVSTAGAVKIADLGMVKTFDDDLALTQTGHAVGTPWYMPLEQAKNAKDTDGRCDIYALGCTLYCLLTGSPPFTGATIVEVIRAKEQGTFPPARSVNPDVPERLDLVIAKMTAKLPRYRYASCTELLHDLEALGLAGTKLLLEPAPARHAPTGPAGATATGPSSAEIVAHPSGLQVEHDPNVWYVRLKGPGAQVSLQKLTTAQLQKKLADGAIDPRAKASHNPRDGFRALATYAELGGVAISRASKDAADKSSVRYRNLYKKIEEQDQRREATEQRPSAWPSWLPLALTLGGIVLAILLLIIFLYWAATSLAG